MVHAGQAVAHELLRDVRDAVALALRRAAPAVNVGRVPDAVEHALRARSVTRPLSSPSASRSKVPPGGFGVSLVTPAISNALLL